VPESFVGCVIRRGLWPLLSPDITHCDSFVRGFKHEAYETNPHNLQEFRNNTRSEISAVSREELRRVNNFLHSFTECIRSGEQYLQHLLWHWWVSIRLSKGYCHSESSSRFLNRHISRDSACNLTLEERWSGAYRPGRETHRIQWLKVTTVCLFCPWNEAIQPTCHRCCAIYAYRFTPVHLILFAGNVIFTSNIALPVAFPFRNVQDKIFYKISSSFGTYTGTSNSGWIWNFHLAEKELFCLHCFLRDLISHIC
jgi:hypothetical protein